MLLKRVSLRSRSAESSPWVCLTWLASAQCVDLVFGIVFHRGMAWKREARARLEKRRTEILGPCGEARGRPQGDRCDLNSSESRPHDITSKPTVLPYSRYNPGVRGDLAGPHASIRPGISPSVLRTRTADRVSEYPIRKRSSRDRNYLPHRDGDFPSPPGLELDCPLRNPCRATHSSSGVERLPWE